MEKHTPQPETSRGQIKRTLRNRKAITVKVDIYVVVLSSVFGWHLIMDIKTKDHALVVIPGHKSCPSDFLSMCALENNMCDGRLGIPHTMVPNNMALC